MSAITTRATMSMIYISYSRNICNKSVYTYRTENYDEYKLEGGMIELFF